ncbi:hypothetical protein [Mucilaginibacter polytrichastri]|nr:hypothetical protein [Mucilaginibacter polytrichastri]
MTKAINNHSWQMQGRVLKTDAPGSFEEGTITIPEQTSNLGMRQRTKDPSRQNSTPQSNYFGVPVDTDLAVQLIKNGLIKNKMIANRFLKDKAKNAELIHFVEEVVGLSYGITFDKTIILKILSQPKCEGLRAYLCARPEEKQYHTSLVMLGVDADGYDLNYEITSEEKASPTSSLLVEYGYPPNGTKFSGTEDDPIDEHYILLNKAKLKK